jgi:hypothetical protein
MPCIVMLMAHAVGVAVRTGVEVRPRPTVHTCPVSTCATEVGARTTVQPVAGPRSVGRRRAAGAARGVRKTQSQTRDRTDASRAAETRDAD